MGHSTASTFSTPPDNNISEFNSLLSGDVDNSNNIDPSIADQNNHDANVI